MQIESKSADFLTAELQAHGLYYLVGQQHVPAVCRLKSDELIAELTQQQDARLRSALIPLFLQQSQLVDVLPLALSHLDIYGQTTLKIYYTVAVILQHEFASDLQRHLPYWRHLPDRYSDELGIVQEASCDERLRQIGEIHTRLTGLVVNWPGTYRHAAKNLIQRLELDVRWAA